MAGGVSGSIACGGAVVIVKKGLRGVMHPQAQKKRKRLLADIIRLARVWITPTSFEAGWDAHAQKEADLTAAAEALEAHIKKYGE